MAFFKALYLLSIVLTPIKGLNCPSIDDMPVMYGDTFACAQRWRWWSYSPYSVDSCNGLLRDTTFEFDYKIIILQANPGIIWTVWTLMLVPTAC